MKKLSVLALSAIFVTVMASAAMAGEVVSLFGDKDGFGIGVVAGSGFDYNSVGPADGDGTDAWMYGDFQWTQTYSLGGLAGLSATFEIFHGGIGWGGVANLYIDNQFVGALTDGDDVGPDYNYAWKDVFDMTPFLGLLTGSNVFKVVAPGGDGWALDYAELTISDQGPVVPIPAAAWLLGSGLIGLAGLRKRFGR